MTNAEGMTQLIVSAIVSVIIFSVLIYLQYINFKETKKEIEILDRLVQLLIFKIKG